MKAVASFLARHSLAAVVTTLAALIAWTFLYFGLLVWAILTNGGLGGPLTYPAGLLFMAPLSLLSCAVLFMPAVGFAEWLTAKTNWSIFLQIPISTAAMALLVFIVGLGCELYYKPELNLASYFGTYGIIVALWMLPLGLYWWIAECFPIVKLLMLESMKLRRF